MDLSKYGQDLYESLKITPHPLENYIMAIDNNLEVPSLLRVIGEKIGIDVYNDQDPAFSLYFILKDYLEKEEDPEETQKKINMTLTEFSKLHPEYNEEEIYPLYVNRLLN